jgi:uncharacterized protein (TIGR02145 family)
MKIKTAWRVLAFSAVLGLGGIGCGGGDNPSGGDNYNGGSNNNGGNNNNGGGGTLSCGTRECASALMPDGKTWMTENLNKTTADSWCYDDSPANCAKYGRLYTWEAAKAACLSVGKRLPTREEWGALAKAAGGTGDYGTGGTAGKKLKSRSGWNNNGNGTDDYGFSALPGGYRNYYGGSFITAGDFGLWWTVTELGSGGAYLRDMDSSYDGVHEDDVGKSNGYSVRCLQD